MGAKLSVTPAKADVYAVQLALYSAEPNDYLRQCAIFRKTGFVLIRPDSLLEDIADGLETFCVAYENEFKTCCNYRRPQHWSMQTSRWWECPSMISLLEHPTVMSICHATVADGWSRFHITKLAGDMVLPGCDYDQETHSDPTGLEALRCYWNDNECAWDVYGFHRTPAIALSIATKDILPDDAPMLISTIEDHKATARSSGVDMSVVRKE